MIFAGIDIGEFAAWVAEKKICLAIIYKLIIMAGASLLTFEFECKIRAKKRVGQIVQLNTTTIQQNPTLSNYIAAVFAYVFVTEINSEKFIDYLT